VSCLVGRTMPSWIDDEPGVRATLRQAARLLRGGLRRPVATVAISLLLVSTFVGKLALAPHIYSPKLVLRVVEMESDPLSASGPRHDMDGYVREVVWTDDVLLDLINRHNLYGGLIHEGGARVISQGHRGERLPELLSSGAFVVGSASLRAHRCPFSLRRP